MGRSLKLITGLILGFLLLTTSFAIAKTDSFVDKSPYKKVFLLIANEISVNDLANPKLKNINELLEERASIALMSARTAAPQSTPYRSYTTLGAGNRATAGRQAAEAVNIFEKALDFEGKRVSAVDIYYRRTGDRTDDSNILHLGIPAVKKSNNTALYNAKIGILGDILKEQGIKTAVYGNADRGFDISKRRREAVLVAVDSRGRVDFGNISSSVNENAPLRPFGLKTNFKAIENDIGKLPDNKNLFIVIDTGDTSRAAAYSSRTKEAVYKKYKSLALVELDEFIGNLILSYGFENTLYIIAAPTPAPESKPREELTPVIIFGDGFSKGLLTSATTRRNGIITLVDLAPTIVNQFNSNIGLPKEMTGSMIRYVKSNINFQKLQSINKYTILIDELRPAFVFAFIALQVITFIFAGLVLWTGAYDNWIFKSARILLLSVMVVPVSFLLTGLLATEAAIIPFVVILLTTVVILTTASILLFKDKLVSILAISIATYLMIVIDVLFGAKLNMNTILGYSPIIAGRFYGIGNQMMSVLLAVSLVLVASFQDIRRKDSIYMRAFQLFLFAATLVIVGLPDLGANTGGTITFLAAFWAAYVYYKKRSLDIIDALKAFGALVIFFIIAVGANMIFSAGSESHLTRMVVRIQDGAYLDLYLTIKRKLLTNWRIFRYSSWSYLFIIVIGLFVALRLRPVGGMNDLFKKYPAFLAATTGCLIGSFVGLVTNDSGISIPALILSYFLPVIFYLILYENKDLQKIKAVENG